VVYVDLEDARAYARWAGKRLLTEEEWQYAAQGPAALKYPWGNEMLPGRCNDGSTTQDTTNVWAYPEGRSPFGCYDMCGNTWEWTESERSDGRTRFCIIRGGSYYKAHGSGWYTDGGPMPTHHAAKFLLIWPGLDRCATIGFRCAVDLGPKEDLPAAPHASVKTWVRESGSTNQPAWPGSAGGGSPQFNSKSGAGILYSSGPNGFQPGLNDAAYRWCVPGIISSGST